MNNLLWIAQILFAFLFLVHGIAAIVKPNRMRAQLDKLPYSSNFLSFIGVCEVLGALGLVLPMRTNIAPWLTPLAAIGLIMIMLGAVRTKAFIRP